MARVAFVLGEDFEDSELRHPYDRLKGAGHEPVLIGTAIGKRIQGKKGKETITTQAAVAEVDADDFDALVVPGGYSPDRLRMDEAMVAFTRSFFDAGKTVAAICHAGSMLVEADAARGRTVTSWPSIRTDLRNAGANWIDQEVVEDGRLITSRKPEDLPAFCDAIIRQLAGDVPGRLAPELTSRGGRRQQDRSAR